MTVLTSPHAQGLFHDILAVIARAHSPQDAVKWRTKILAAIQVREDFPQSGDLLVSITQRIGPVTNEVKRRPSETGVTVKRGSATAYGSAVPSYAARPCHSDRESSGRCRSRRSPPPGSRPRRAAARDGSGRRRHRRSRSGAASRGRSARAGTRSPAAGNSS